ncbi:MAG: O-succinylhomoserine sulfhydrylase [Hyphomicrobiales bacterium]|nr:O-succinylhomoserine sulfhydrylase [Hyphomicrobiales bacterium]MCY4052380.1 O-succinylhomoserine sulfhydrylase [Hyphomicrobiales bacterium]
MAKKSSKQWRPQTRLVHEGTQRSQHGENAEALFLTSGYVYENAQTARDRFAGDADGFIYSRFSNPTVSMFEERMTALEGSETARATATGMAAVTASMLSHLQAGDHVVAAKALFSSCRYVIEDFLPRFGVASTLVDGLDIEQWRAACRPETKAFFLETPTNPRLEILDLRSIADIAHDNGALLVVDNVFATPILQRPMEFGADIVVYSATKYIDGQGRCLGGCVLCSEQFLEDHLRTYMRQTGPAMSPFNAWVMLKGLETLDIRVRRHCDNARVLAEFLGESSAVRRVFYPGLPNHPQHNLAMAQMDGSGGGMIAFELDGDQSRAFRFLDALEVILISNNLGDTKSLITHPTTTTHQRLEEEARLELGIGENLLRLSVGLEDVEDLRDDLEMALAA